MADLLYISVFVAFFASMVAFVRACDRVVGKDASIDSDLATGESGTTTHEEVPA